MAALIPAGSASGTGTVTLQAPVTNNTDVINIPDTTGTMMVSGNMPAFRTYASSAQGTTSGAFTKIAFNTKIFDTNNCFDATTNYRFTPTVAGYYQINAGTSLVGTTSVGTEAFVFIYKNGAIDSFGCGQSFYSTIQNMCTVSNIVYCNGSTDYIEIYAYQNSGGTVNTASGSATTYFSGSMIRSS